MPVARYLTTFRSGKPDVPTGVFADRTDGYGWRVMSHVPWGSCIVELISTQDVLDTTDVDTVFKRVPDSVDPSPWPTPTTGGHGGKVIHVTTLTASGEGSLAAALATQGPRQIVFDVAGTIDLISTGVYTLTVDNPYVSILGDTAPNGGICLKGRLTLRTHDVIVQHLRVRPGPDPVKGMTNGIVLTDTANSYPYNIWIDHCSLSWATDENLTIYPTFGHIIENVMISYSLIYEGLNNSTHPEGTHSMNALISNGWRDLAIHHCLFAHSIDRNPQIAGRVGERARVLFANNVVYSVQEPIWAWGGIRANIIGNIVKSSAQYYDLELSSQQSTVASSLVHIEGNENPNRSFTIRHSGNDAPDYPRIGSRLSMPDVSLTSAEQAYSDVLANAGAFPRDSADTRVIADVQNGTGAIIDDPSEVGSWPDLIA